jgi:hypothetical protein
LTRPCGCLTTASAIGRTPRSMAWPSRPFAAGDGFTSARDASAKPAFPGRRVLAVTALSSISPHTRCCSAGTWGTGTSLRPSVGCTRCRSPTTRSTRISIRRSPRRCARSSRPQVRACATARPRSESRRGGSTGHVCFRSMGRGGSICGRSSWSTGSGRLLPSTPNSCCVGCSTRTVAASKTGLPDRSSARGSGGTSTSGTCSPTSPRTSSASSPTHWTCSTFLWRRPRRNAIAVSRKEGVAALDRFVGPKS